VISWFGIQLVPLRAGLAGLGLWLCWLGNGFERHGEVVPMYVATLAINSYWFYVLFVEGRLVRLMLAFVGISCTRIIKFMTYQLLVHQALDT
jgi:hypothetical protein